ncbi:alpha-L-rhamnosidase [Mucilaginibacter sp. UYP25]|uniref:family 78 glycoside hydrolase catalytic domain n=1 Tax=unclassified Mucilaginibacter TaxID=2617802 RepID=UPI003390B3F7
MKKLFPGIACLLLAQLTQAQVSVTTLRTENLENPISIDTKTPRFSWKIVEDTRRDVTQKAYEIEVDTIETKANTHYWASGKVISDQSIYVAYRGKALKAGSKYFWRVRVWDNYGNASPWTGRAYWQMGLLSTNDWHAKWIGPAVNNEINGPAPLLRATFNSQKTIKAATAYITAHGFYEAQINGKKIGNDYLAPGWTSYNKRLQYQAYDVKNLIKQGGNAIGVTLGNGWYRSPLGPYNPRPDFYGKETGLLLQIEISYTDGSHQRVLSDENWKSSTGSLRSAEIYNGCTIDTRLEQPGWATTMFDDKKWAGVKPQSYPLDNLIATYNEPVRKHENFTPVKVIKTPLGEQVIDFGQNLVGWVSIRVKGKAGDSVKISHAEVLDKAGNFYTENLRAAKAQNIYILKDTSTRIFEPQFTWQGFRFVKVEGLRGKLDTANFKAIAVYSDMKPTGSFECSNPLLNQLQHNIQWGQKGNFLDVPTDCPQRDERLGWTGDAQVFARTATFNMDAHNFFTKWLKDVAADQYPGGSIPFIIPDVFKTGNNEVGGSTGWGDVATIVPWTMYLAYGDKQILENQYPSMQAWVKFIQKQTKNGLWNTGDHFGDWLFYSVNNDRDGSSAITNKYLIAQCFYAYSTQNLVNAAKVLNNKADELYYTKLLAQIKSAFLKEYVTPNGLISSDTQTAYVLALAFDLLPDSLRPQAAQRLVKNIKQYNYHLTTGFLGTPYLCHVLSRFGHADVAYKLLLQDTYPSWLYPIKAGATTIWERWDGIKTDGTFEDPSMNSYNHYAYGAIGDWMYRVIAGIDTKTDGPGYKHIIIKPTLGGALSYANADYETNYGMVRSHWKISAGKLYLDIEIPANATATIQIPIQNNGLVTENGKSLRLLQDKENTPGYQTIEAGSGKYQFVTSWK